MLKQYATRLRAGGDRSSSAPSPSCSSSGASISGRAPRRLRRQGGRRKHPAGDRAPCLAATAVAAAADAAASQPPDMVKSQQAAMLDQFVRAGIAARRSVRRARLSRQRSGARQARHGISGVSGGRQVLQGSLQRTAALERHDRDRSSKPTCRPSCSISCRTRSSIRRSSRRTSSNVATRSRNRSARVDYALIPRASFAATVAVTDEQIQKWYDENKTTSICCRRPWICSMSSLTASRRRSAVKVTEEGARRKGLLRAGQGALRVA